jgi:hypothetical protein
MTAIFGKRLTKTKRVHRKTQINADVRQICEQGTRPIVKIDREMSLG